MVPPARPAVAARRALVWLAHWSPVVVVVVALATCSALRVLHLANADALLPSLMSTQRLTWFFWGQDRLGNVVPALVAPVQDVRWNMTLQLFLVGTGWFSLAALFSANHLAGRRNAGEAVAPRRVAVATVIAGLVTWVVLPAATEVVFVFEQLYAFALTLFLLGLLGITHRGWGRRMAGSGAVLAAMLINPSLVLYTPSVVLFAGVQPVRWHGRRPLPAPPVVRACAVAAAAFVLSSLAARRFGERPAVHTGYNEFSLTKMFDNVSAAFGNVVDSVNAPAALVAIAASIGWLVVRWRRLPPRLYVTYLVAPLFALGWTFLFSGNTWVLLNMMFPRYFFPLYAVGLLYVAAAASDLVTQVAERGSVPFLGADSGSVAVGREGVRAWAAVVPLLAVVGGVITLSRIEIDALTRVRPWADAATAHEVDLAVGGYWATWPVVIEARERGLDMLGVEDRSVAIDDMISDRIREDLAGGRPVTVLCTDSDATHCTETLNAWSPVPLTSSSVLAESPLIIEVVPDG